MTAKSVLKRSLKSILLASVAVTAAKSPVIFSVKVLAFAVWVAFISGNASAPAEVESDAVTVGSGAGSGTGVNNPDPDPDPDPDG